MGQVFEFGVEALMQLPIGLVVCGRCWDAEFGVGDVFTELRWSVSDRRGSPPEYAQVAEGIAAEVRLRVDEISAYDRLIDRMYPGLTGGVRFSGPGLQLLGGIDYSADIRAGKSWWLWGQRHAAPRACTDENT